MIAGLSWQNETVCAYLPAEDTSDYLQDQEIQNLNISKRVENAILLAGNAI